MIVYCLCKTAAMHGVRSELQIAYHLHLCSWHLLPLLTAARGCHGYELFIRCVAAAFLFFAAAFHCFKGFACVLKNNDGFAKDVILY